MTESASSRNEANADTGPPPPAGRLPVAARRHPLIAEVRRRMVRYVKVSGPARMVLGVSGGPDSIALLVAVLAIRQQRSAEVRPEPIIVHVNHHLRDSASRDAAFVQSLGEQFGVPVAVRDVYPGQADENLAAAARLLRYRALGAVAREHEAQYIAVAHHAEDQLESMLMALCRGSGLEGISAMPWSRPLDSSGGGGLMLIRPLLATRKAECESLCEAAGIAWCEDQSNRDLSRRRNRLRHDVLPILESCWPDAPMRAAVTAELLHEAMQLLEAELVRHFGSATQRTWSRDALRSLTPVLIAAGLRRAALAALGERETSDAEALTQRVLLPAAEAVIDSDRSPRRFALTRDLTVEVRATTVELQRAP